MNTHSGPANLNLPPNSGKITILEDISIGSLFKTVKASRGTKIIVLKTAVEESSMSTELLRREFEISRTISHPNIVDTLSFEEDTPIGPAIVMEYIDGVTLSEYIASKPGVRERFSVLSDILSAVEYLHKKGILHNDIKPDNIIVSRNGTARLIDFGLSVSNDSLYKGVCGGSNGFSAPEILRGEGPAGASSDIYSIGNILRQLIPGKKYSVIISRCLEDNPTLRYQSVFELKRAIHWRRYSSAIVAAGVLVVLVVASLAILFAASDRQEAQIHSMISSQQEQERLFQSQLSEAEELLKSSYERALTDMKRQKYYEFAGLVKGAYLVDYVKYESEIPPEEKLAIQTVFAQQCHVLDSILTSLPSITTLPKEEQGELIEMVNEGRIQKNTSRENHFQ